MISKRVPVMNELFPCTKNFTNIIYLIFTSIRQWSSARGNLSPRVYSQCLEIFLVIVTWEVLYTTGI